MIITALHAEHFRKYQHLQLDNLPERGLIALVGGNESGKSSIGDAIQFGLFGRTGQLLASDAAKLIQWGAEQATVTLRLQHRGHEYRLVRSVNAAGEIATMLFSTEEEITLADTPDAVAQQLRALFGYQYGAFAKAFYWGYQQTDSPQRDSHNLLTLAGLQEYAHLVDQFKGEIQVRQDRIEELLDQQTHLQQAITALPNATEALPKLQSLSQDLSNQQQHLLQVGKTVDKAAETYPVDLERYQTISQRTDSITRWTKISLIAFLITLCVGVALLIDALWQPLELTLPSPTTRDFLGRSLVRIASVLAIIGAGLLVYGWYIDMRHLKPLQNSAQQLVNTLQTAYNACIQPVRSLMGQETAQHFDQRPPAIVKPDNDANALADIPEWLAAVTTYATKPLYILRAADALNQGLTHHHTVLGQYAALLQTDIDTEQGQITQREHLQAALWEQEEAEQAERREQVVTHTAIDLLQRDASHNVSRFNQLVKKHCPQLLQRFTQSHYKTLEVHPDFSIQVLSEEKGDYLEFNEMSVGTQRQVALALQIALATALADATKAEMQLLFLDEPFAFFDPERTDTALHSLQESTQSSLCQIWMTTQTIPTSVICAKVIECPQGTTTLQA